MTEETPDALLGVVTPELPGMPPRQLDHALDIVHRNLDAVRARLTELRAQRDEINAEVKLLVHDEELLERMARVAKIRKS